MQTREHPTANLETGSVREMSSDALEAEIVSLAQRLSAGTYELLVLVGELDTRGTWAAWGAISCAAWLADVCDIEIATARTQVRVARAVRHHHGLDAALKSGDVSYAKARVLVPHLTDANETALVRPGGLHASGPPGGGDRRVVTPQRGPRRHRPPSPPRTVGVVAHRPRRDGHHHRPTPTTPRRRHHRRGRPTGHGQPRARGRVPAPTTSRRPHRHHHQRQRQRIGRRRDRDPRPRRRPHPPGRRHTPIRPRRDLTARRRVRIPAPVRHQPPHHRRQPPPPHPHPPTTTRHR
ncbi:MAG: DUF222 domain-containing protein [Acidimicrobiia bacterium]|nr:DUF222 domain-containing protein [Acidimicrobiia bacterium]